MFSKILVKKTASKNIFNEYTYLLKYIKEKDILCTKLHLEEKHISYTTYKILLSSYLSSKNIILIIVINNINKELNFKEYAK